MKPDDPEKTSGKTLNVLMIEDSEDDYDREVRALQTGFTPSCQRVETAAQMRCALEQRSWDVILADYRLPGFSSTQAFAIYRERGLDIPFIIVSGVIGEEAAVDAMKAGVHDYIMKDKPGRLVSAVRRELAETENRKQRARVTAELEAAYSELAAIYAHCPEAMLVVDQDLRIERANEAAAQLAGRKVSEMEGLYYGEAFCCPDAKILPSGFPDGPACSACPLRLAALDAARGQVVLDRVQSIVRSSLDGQPKERWLLVSCSRIECGSRLRILICAKDITELQQAHVDLQKQKDELALQALLINQSQDAVIVTDAARTIRSWNRGAEEIYGWTSYQAVGSHSYSLLATTSACSLAETEQLLERNGRWEGELNQVRQNGQSLIADSRQILLRDGAGRTVGVMEINRDITQRRRDENTLRETVRAREAALAEKTVLLQEVHHRVKNNLAVIASLLNLKAAATENADARSALRESQDRVHSIAVIHEQLYGNGNLDRINFSDYAGRLARELHQALVHEPDRIRIHLAIEPIELALEQAVPCGLILNELISNACKYAFPDGRRGEISLSFRECEPRTLELAVEDDGIGLPAGLLGNPNTQSLGLKIVDILTGQLNGSVKQQPSAGTRIEVRFQYRPPAAEPHS